LLPYIETPLAMESFALIQEPAANRDYKPLLLSSQ